MSVRCRVCHDELLKACAELATLTVRVGALTGALRLTRAKANRDRCLREEAVAERDEARARLAEIEWELRVLKGSE